MIVDNYVYNLKYIYLFACILLIFSFSLLMIVFTLLQLTSDENFNYFILKRLLWEDAKEIWFYFWRILYSHHYWETKRAPAKLLPRPQLNLHNSNISYLS